MRLRCAAVTARVVALGLIIFRETDEEQEEPSWRSVVPSHRHGTWI